MKTIIKRDGRKKSYDFSRIDNAITKAYKEVYQDQFENTNNTYDFEIAKIEKNIEDEINKIQDNEIDIETIQDVVVFAIKSVNKVVAKAYEDYRERRTEEREKKGLLDNEIDNIIKSVSEESTSNGNVDGSKIQSIRALISNVACRNYSRRHYIPRKYRKKHLKSIYVHDESYFGLPFFNCCLVDWQNMFKYGFKLGTTDIETPKSLNTAIDILSQVASHVSSNTYGGTTFPQLIKGLTPYAKLSLNKYKNIAKMFVKEELQDEYIWTMFEKEAKNTAQSIEYEVQTLVTSRGETPFLTLGIDCIDLNADEETKKIQRILTKAILNQRLEGLTGGVTPVFPKLVYQLDKGNNLDIEDENYELFKLSVMVSAFRQYPDYTMTDRVKEVTGNYKEPMGK